MLLILIKRLQKSIHSLGDPVIGAGFRGVCITNNGTWYDVPWMTTNDHVCEWTGKKIM